MADVVFRQVPVDSGEGAAMLAEYAAEIAAMYEGADLSAPGMPAAGPAEFSSPTGAFLIGYDGPAGPAVCCGALKRLEDEGYAPVADYNANPLAAWWGEKRF